MNSSSQAMQQMLRQASPVIPVITLREHDDALALADALAEAQVNTLEITLRSEHGLPAIRALRQARPDLVVGAGTVLTAQHVAEAVDAGAQFLVSPGFSADALAAAHRAGVPYLPGTATITEMMAVQAAGLTCAKLFPADVVGGVAMLKAAASVLPELYFCPTGGVNQSNLADFIAQPNVLCVGGSWLCPATAVGGGDWSTVTRLARAATGAG